MNLFGQLAMDQGDKNLDLHVIMTIHTIRADMQCNEENSRYLDIIVLDISAVRLLRTSKKRGNQFYKRV